MPPNPPLRIAILIDSTTVTQWQHQMLEKIQSTEVGTVAFAFIRGDTDQPIAKPPLAQSLLNSYLRWDAKKFAEKPTPYKQRQITEIDPSIAVRTIKPNASPQHDSLEESDIDSLRKLDIDVMIQLGWRQLQGKILSLPRYGVWSYQYGNNPTKSDGLAGIQEHYYGDICTSITLQILSEDSQNALIIDRTNIATDKSSVSKTQFKLYWRSAYMLPRKVAELHQLGYENFRQRATRLKPERDTDFRAMPLLNSAEVNVTTALRYITRNFSAYIKRALFQRRFDEKWMLYFKLGDQLSTSVNEFHKIESSNDRYWADPHVIERDGVFYVFVEEFIQATEKGRIAVIQIDQDGTVGEAQTVLEADYHLSYPFVFEHEGHTYMLPEASDNRSLDLYQCVSFPNQWKPVKSLMHDLRAKDATLFQHDGLWWLFLNLCELKDNINDELDELHLYSAKHFMTDEWTPHSKTVVVSDVRHARPAGALIRKDGKIYRPAQDCSVDYGYALQLQQIIQLNEDDFEEIQAARITPDWSEEIIGVHSLSYVPGITVVDAKRLIKKSDIEKP